MKTDLNYCIVLSSEQLTYLAGSKYGIDRMKIPVSYTHLTPPEALLLYNWLSDFINGKDVQHIANQQWAGKYTDIIRCV